MLLVVGLAFAPIDALALNPLNRIVIIGDSIQAGTNLANADLQASHQLQKRGNVIVHNFSSPGAALIDVLFSLGMKHATDAMWLLNGYSGMYGVVINLGTNDYGHNADLTTFFNDYVGFLSSLPSNVRVICMGPTWSTTEGQPNGIGLVKDHYRFATWVACASKGFPYIEGKNAIPNSTAYFPDGVHPNDAGHRLMGIWLKNELTTLGWLPRTRAFLKRQPPK